LSTPFYVSPEQLMKDRADFARKGIARGRSVVVIQYADGILFVSENPSQALHKVSEIYDRIAFAAVGRYNEFENLRIAGVRLADMRGYAYDRRDVTGRGLANAYAQTLGSIFSSGGEKPYEVEIFVAEVGESPADDQVYRLTYDGQVADEHGFAVMGGAADVVAGHLREHYAEGATLQDAVRLAVAALGHSESDDRVIPTRDLEVAALDRTRQQPRKFVRLRESRLIELLGERGPEQGGTPQGEDTAGANGPTAPVVDDPGDPTDQVSGGTPPLEHPVSGEPTQPPVAPPVAPPTIPPTAPPATRPTPAPEPTDPAAPGEPKPPAPQPPPPDPSQPPAPGTPPADPGDPLP
jgi:proteasome alpha subunit